METQPLERTIETMQSISTVCFDLMQATKSAIEEFTGSCNQPAPEISQERIESADLAKFAGLGLVMLGANIVHSGKKSAETFSRATSQIRPVSKELVKLVLPIIAPEPKSRRSQVLRGKKRFVANPEAVAMNERFLITSSDCGTPLGHRPQEELLA